MKSLKKLAHIADKFESKLSKRADDGARQNQQKDTHTLFFGVGYEAKNFMSNVMDDNGPFKKYLIDLATKLQKSVAVDMKANAVPKKGASWMINVSPPNIKAPVLQKLNEEFQKVTNKSLTQAQTEADQGAKAGNGTGIANVFNVNLDM